MNKFKVGDVLVSRDSRGSSIMIVMVLTETDLYNRNHKVYVLYDYYGIAYNPIRLNSDVWLNKQYEPL